MYLGFLLGCQGRSPILQKFLHQSNELLCILVRILVKDYRKDKNPKQKSQLKMRSSTSLWGVFLLGSPSGLEILTKILTKIMK